MNSMAVGIFLAVDVSHLATRKKMEKWRNVDDQIDTQALDSENGDILIFTR